MALYLFRSNPKWQAAAILENFEWTYLRNWLSAQLNVSYSAGFSWLADRMALLLVWSNARWRPWRDMTEDMDKSRAMSLFAKLLFGPCISMLNTSIAGFCESADTSQLASLTASYCLYQGPQRYLSWYEKFNEQRWEKTSNTVDRVHNPLQYTCQLNSWYNNCNTTLCSEKKHPLTYSFISPCVMCRFKQKLQGIYLRNGRFWPCRN